jgi:KipI family sensor histidine kinase inhibitor
VTTLRPYGEHALLAEPADPATVPAVRAAVAAEPGVVDAVAGARTVLAVWDPMLTTSERVAAVLRGRHDTAAAVDGPTVRIAVVYDGADLEQVAREIGLEPGEVVALHSGAEYTVRFCGFSPGFAYLDGLPPSLHVPRRDEPRTSVPAGSVAVAGEFAGVYPRVSPGGWRLLGRTDAVLWDVARAEPALLVPGTRVRFEPA